MAVEHPEFQQLAAIYASSCHPMLAFAGFHAGLCRTLLAQMLEFVTLHAQHLVRLRGRPGHEHRAAVGHRRVSCPCGV